jgi:hypothetical protein
MPCDVDGVRLRRLEKLERWVLVSQMSSINLRKVICLHIQLPDQYCNTTAYVLCKLRMSKYDPLGRKLETSYVVTRVDPKRDIHD